MKTKYLTKMGGSFEKVEGGYLARILILTQTSKKDKGIKKTTCCLSPLGDDDCEMTPYPTFEEAETAVKAYCAEPRNWTIHKICENCKLEEGEKL